MAFDAAGNLYVTCFSASDVVKFDNTGINLGSFGSGYSTPESIVFDAAGDIYVGNLGNGIRKYDPSGTFIGTVIDTRVDWFDLTADQSTFRYGQEGNVVKTVSNAIPGISSPDFATGLTQAFAMRILGDGGLLVADMRDIKRFDSGGNLIQTYDVTGQDGWFALNLDPDGTSFWSGDYTNDKFFKFDIGTGGMDVHLLEVDTGLGGNNLFGLVVYGEQTAATGSISGMKFNDLNGDGTKDAGETGLPGWTIQLYDATGVLLISTVTDANGNYVFGSLPSGDYTVAEVLQAGWTQTYPPGGTYAINVAAGQNVGDVDFGNTEDGGGPGPGPEVGGDVSPTSKVALLAPWIALAAVIIGGTTLFVRRRLVKS